jgi:anthranilate phosphoribosyltransferase
MLKDIAPLLRKIAYREDLTLDEARIALNTIGAEDRITELNETDGYYLLALTLGVMAKGPSSSELHGFVLSISDQSVKFATTIDPAVLIDVSGTGGDRIKTFNVGTASSFVLAAGGVNVAKQATRSYTGFTGSADVFSEIGLDPTRISRASVVERLERFGLVAFYTPAFTGGFKNRIDFLTKLKTIGLTYPTPWHLVSWVYSPFKMDARIYGVFDARYVPVVAELFLKLGYRRVLVVHGVDGLDEISNTGATKIAELNNGSITTYEVTPEDLGVKRAQISAIQTLTDSEFLELRDPKTPEPRRQELEQTARAKNLETFFRVLYGRSDESKQDLVAVNAGAGFYLCGKSKTLKDGVTLAKDIIAGGQAGRKLEDVAGVGDAPERVGEWKRRLGL